MLSKDTQFVEKRPPLARTDCSSLATEGVRRKTRRVSRTLSRKERERETCTLRRRESVHKERSPARLAVGVEYVTLRGTEGVETSCVITCRSVCASERDRRRRERARERATRRAFPPQDGSRLLRDSYEASQRRPRAWYAPRDAGEAGEARVVARGGGVGPDQSHHPVRARHRGPRQRARSRRGGFDDATRRRHAARTRRRVRGRRAAA